MWSRVLGVICGNLLVVAWGSYLSGMARRRVLLAQFHPGLDPRKHLHLVQKSSGGRGGKVWFIHSTTIAEVTQEPPVEMRPLIWT